MANQSGDPLGDEQARMDAEDAKGRTVDERVADGDHLKEADPPEPPMGGDVQLSLDVGKLVGAKANPALTPPPIQQQAAPADLESEAAFIPSGAKVVPLSGWLGLTAPPAPPRRRKQPARDQLKLFG